MPLQSNDPYNLLQNIAAISADFHTHVRYDEFYETGCETIGGFFGVYDICIEMAQVLTLWELENGGELPAYDELNVMWVDVFTQYVNSVITRIIDSGIIVDFSACLRELPILSTPKAGAPEVVA